MEKETYADDESVIRAVAKPTTGVDIIKQHRFHALVDGFFLGVGFVFLIMGVFTPMLVSQQMVMGLLLIIGGILCLATGTILEVYQWAKLD
jgi:hypothetical protein